MGKATYKGMMKSAELVSTSGIPENMFELDCRKSRVAWKGV
jgi:hypothetical protein